MTIQEILRKCFHLSPLDSELLLSLAIKKPKEYLFTHPEHKLNKTQVARYELYVTRRLRGEPIAYITGKKEFYGLEFFVNKNVLIPRPETELLVEASLRRIMNYDLRIKNMIDMGTGSGNIIISVIKNIPAKQRKKIKFFAVDISKKSLLIAKKNAERHDVEKFIKLIKSDLLDYFQPRVEKKKIKLENLLIIANLPYVSPQMYRKNSKNLKYEPKTALVSNKGGISHYIKLLKQIKELSITCYVLHATCYMEISPEQKSSLSKIVKKQLPSAKINFSKDLSGRPRIAKIRLY